ncbi:hypothetical protein PLICRDRAFT_235329 [Plicaturopsis crispa FD-325 SS-3]|nr:hypothetical protein PLICRDRAFT_235329 [Plicaturopsis crispa FD-325 SS-3]
MLLILRHQRRSRGTDPGWQSVHAVTLIYLSSVARSHLYHEGAQVAPALPSGFRHSHVPSIRALPHDSANLGASILQASPKSLSPRAKIVPSKSSPEFPFCRPSLDFHPRTSSV